MVRPEILAIVPARGGSKSIPRKNLIPVGGRPLIAYSIEQARTSRLVTRTIVSTDDAEIADVARAHGGEVPFLRPAQYAQDLSPDCRSRPRHGNSCTWPYTRLRRRLHPPRRQE